MMNEFLEAIFKNWFGKRRTFFFSSDFFYAFQRENLFYFCLLFFYFIIIMRTKNPLHMHSIAFPVEVANKKIKVFVNQINSFFD